MTGTPRRFGLATAFASLGAFLFLFHRVGTETWGHGQTTIYRMLAMAAIVLAAPAVARLEARVGTSRMFGALAIACSFVLGHRLYEALRTEIASPRLEGIAIDIARNVHAAGTHLLAGRNPYVERCQLGHLVEPGGHVSLGADGQLRMYGLPYHYGFPYFPTMILAYLPFRELAPGLHSIRVGNGFYLALGAVGVAWLASRSVPRGQRTLAVGLSLLGYLAIDVLAPEHFSLAVTDIALAVVVFGYVAASYGRPLVAGVVLGLVQGGKLLPGPLVALPAIASFATARERRLAFASYAITSALVIVPAIVPDPASFVASTIAFYLTYHGEGDNSSLYWFLPAWAKAPFLLVGLGLAAFFALRSFRKPGGSIASSATDAFLAYFLFTAFNRMTHLNYLWGVHTLGAVAIGCAALDSRSPAKSTAAAARGIASP